MEFFTSPEEALAQMPKWLTVLIAGVTVLVLLVAHSHLSQEKPLAGFPVASIDGASPKSSWLQHGRQLVTESVAKYSGPFQIMSGTGPKIMLPNRFGDELRNHPDLSFHKAFMRDFFTTYPGFEPFKQGWEDDTLIQQTVRVKLTQSLNLVTGDLVEETRDSLQEIVGDASDWQGRLLKDMVLDIVTRLSSRVFLGKELCRNQRWLEIAKNYTVQSFIATHLMRMVPSILRPIAYWFIPQCRFCRQAVADAHKLIDPEVDRRIAEVNKALLAGNKPKKTADAIGWIYEVSQGRKVDYVNAQLALALAAIHTTSETTSQAILDLCEYPEIVEPLRQEIIQVIGEHGWQNTSLYKLKLMDSFLKESQRFRPLATTSMNRFVDSAITLSDGSVLPAGSRINVAENFMDPTVYERPDTFDAFRFLKLREQPGNENNFQFVATGKDHMLFGLGQHACPGRFFASNEMKIALCHLLLKYDWRFRPGQMRPESECFEASASVNHLGIIEIKRRQEEIPLDGTP